MSTRWTPFYTKSFRDTTLILQDLLIIARVIKVQFQPLSLKNKDQTRYSYPVKIRIFKPTKTLLIFTTLTLNLSSLNVHCTVLFCCPSHSFNFITFHSHAALSSEANKIYKNSCFLFTCFVFRLGFNDFGVDFSLLGVVGNWVVRVNGDIEVESVELFWENFVC